MRFKCNPDKRKWHRWFAWYPVHVPDADCRWLEYVERRLIGYTIDIYTVHTLDNLDYATRFRYEYRLPLSQEQAIDSKENIHE